MESRIIFLSFVVCFFIATINSAASVHRPHIQFYHRDVGIPEAGRVLKQTGNMEPRIVGGSLAPVGKHPYLIGLLISLVTNEMSMCTASLLSHTRALTAAHCCWDGQLMALRYELVFASTILKVGGLRVHTKQIEMHAEWYPPNRINDIAILSFASVKYSKLIQPIRLPSDSILKKGLTDTWAEAAGFGKTTDYVHQMILHDMKLKVISNAECQRDLPGGVIGSSMMCTSGAGLVGTCGGDSGGPLTIQSNNSHFIIGVTAFGTRSCETGAPSVYTRVTSFVPWIKQRL